MNANRDFERPQAWGDVRCTPFPAWARVDPWPEEAGTATEAFADDGVLRLLRETQFDLTAPGVAAYFRLVQRIRSRTGAERAAHVVLEFDPSYERLEVHRIGVWRQGTWIEHARADAFQLLRREQGLEALALDGRLTATLLIPDLRVDDTLEVAFTRFSHHPVLDGKFGAWLRFDAFVPWIETRQRINRPIARKLWLQGFNNPPPAEVQIVDGVEQSVWQSHRPQRVEPDDLQVPWTIKAPCYQVTEFEHWSEVAQLFEPHYRDTVLPQEVVAKLEELRLQHADPAERVVEWLRFVQSELRYFALSLGEGGLVPRPLETIWARRFGDCKDATRLYVAGARHLGLDVCAALVSTTHGFSVNGLLPGLHVFDHVIARVRLASGATYWLDPTRRRQGGSLANVEQFQLGWALPLAPETAALEPLPPAQPLEHMCCDESIEIGPRADSPAVVTRLLQFKHWSADDLRNQLQNDGPSKLAAALLRQVQGNWPGAVESVPVSIEDDPVANVLTLSATYAIQNAWKATEGASGKVQFALTDNFSNDALTPIRDAPRSTDFFLGRPHRMVWKARLRMPRKWRGEGWSRVSDEAGIRYTTELVVDEKSLMATRVLTVGGWSAPPSQAQGYSRLVTETKRNMTLLYARTLFGRIGPAAGRGGVLLFLRRTWWRFALIAAVIAWNAVSIMHSESTPDTPLLMNVHAPTQTLSQLADPQTRPDAKAQTARSANELFSEEGTDDTYMRDWLSAVQMVSLDSNNQAYDRFRKLIAAPAFRELTTRQQHAGLLLAGLTGLDEKDYQGAHGYLLRSSEMGPASVTDWSARFVTAGSLKDWDDSVHALTVMLQRWPTAIKDVKSQAIFSLLQPPSQTPRARAAVYELTRALFDAGWKTDDAAEPSPAWALLIEGLTERGDLDGASRVLLHVHSPRVLLSLRVDRRYEALLHNYPGLFDIAAASRQQVNEYLEGTFQRPRNLDAQVQLASAYLDVGDYSRALSLTDNVIADVTSAGSVKSLYDDGPEELNWIYDCRARALAGMGKWGEAETELRRAADQLEEGQPNVDNVINLAAFYADLGRGQDALDVLERLLTTHARVSAFGKAQVEHTRLTAALSLHDTAAVSRSLGYLREHQSDSLSTFQSALLRAGAADEAARLLIRRLQDPALRTKALDSVQTYTELPRSALLQQIEAQWRALLSRPEVKAAIDKVGRQEKVPLPPP